MIKKIENLCKIIIKKLTKYVNWYDMMLKTKFIMLLNNQKYDDKW
jgi:hypothetical protein